MTRTSVVIVGGGPAGAAAAVTARQEGASVEIVEKATSPRHKVCGEFISPGSQALIEALGLWNEFVALCPSRLQRCRLHLGKHTKQWTFPEAAFGLSRLRLDQLLLGRAAALGAAVRRGEIFNAGRRHLTGTELILACGRRPLDRQRERLFGFKAHFQGPWDDAVDLFFDAGGYTGVSGIEDGLTNVCGIARESVLRKWRFDFDEVVRRSPPLAERLAPLRRRMRWLAVAPLSFSPPTPAGSMGSAYLAGDALGFVDPFTGSGILNALLTGRLAGLAATRGIAAARYHSLCRSSLRKPFVISSALRRLAGRSEVYLLARCLPGEPVFRSTRANVTNIMRTAETAGLVGCC